MDQLDEEEHHNNLMFILTILSGTVIVNTFIYKAPQVYDILRSGSSAGLSMPSVVSEGIAYTIMFTYQFAMQFPFDTYADVSMMVLQDIVLTGVILHNREQVDFTIVLWSLLYIFGSLAVALKWFPDSIILLLIGSTTPMLCYSKMDQLFKIVWAGDAGVVSAVTWFIAVYNTAVRMLTTAVITKDIPMFINLSSSEVLNVAIFVSILYFQDAEPKRRA